MHRLSRLYGLVSFTWRQVVTALMEGFTHIEDRVFYPGGIGWLDIQVMYHILQCLQLLSKDFQRIYQPNNFLKTQGGGWPFFLRGLASHPWSLSAHIGSVSSVLPSSPIFSFAGDRCVYKIPFLYTHFVGIPGICV